MTLIKRRELSKEQNMMILIADAGGTKTDWQLVKGDKITQFFTQGFNPNTHEMDDFIKEIEYTFRAILVKVEKLFFYGASVYPENSIFKEGISRLFPNAQVETNNDLLGSCRSLSANAPAFVGILGTGSAGCYYDGTKVINHRPSLGHALGDEGSGAILGKNLLTLALRKRLDSSLQTLFDQEFKLTKEKVYAHVYNGEAPNTYLASFVKFLLKNKRESQIHELLSREFRSYFEAFFMDMKGLHDYPFHFTGSVAYYFGDFIREIGSELNLTISRIVQSPIAGLTLYHQSN